MIRCSTLCFELRILVLASIRVKWAPHTAIYKRDTTKTRSACTWSSSWCIKQLQKMCWSQKTSINIMIPFIHSWFQYLELGSGGLWNSSGIVGSFELSDELGGSFLDKSFDEPGASFLGDLSTGAQSPKNPWLQHHFRAARPTLTGSVCMLHRKYLKSNIRWSSHMLLFCLVIHSW